MSRLEAPPTGLPAPTRETRRLVGSEPFPFERHGFGEPVFDSPYLEIASQGRSSEDEDRPERKNDRATARAAGDPIDSPVFGPL